MSLLGLKEGENTQSVNFVEKPTHLANWVVAIILILLSILELSPIGRKLDYLSAGFLGGLFITGFHIAFPSIISYVVMQYPQTRNIWGIFFFLGWILGWVLLLIWSYLTYIAPYQR